MKKRKLFRKSRKLSWKFVLPCLLAIVLIGGVFWAIRNDSSDKSAASPVGTASEEQQNVQSNEDSQQESDKPVQTEEKPAVQQQASTWPVQLTSEQAASLTVVVNKKHKLPSNYVPSLKGVAGGQMRPEAATAMQSLLNAASAAGVPMSIVSSYRSYQTQVTTYQKWVDLQGKAEADRGSARPGHSEHQTGLAADLDDGSGCNLLECFGNTAGGKWLAENAQEYGFIIRYQAGKEPLTGYQYEPWHIRYVGVDTAKAIVASGKTMDQYYGVEAGSY